VVLVRAALRLEAVPSNRVITTLATFRHIFSLDL
jgi:flagellar biosynthesis protein FliP